MHIFCFIFLFPVLDTAAHKASKEEKRVEVSAERMFLPYTYTSSAKAFPNSLGTVTYCALLVAEHDNRTPLDINEHSVWIFNLPFCFVNHW